MIINEYQKAIEDFNKYIILVPNDYRGYKNRGECYLHLGDKKKYKADLEKASRIRYKR